MKDLFFILANAKLPREVVTSTARKGDKWSKEVKTGDVVNLMVTESGANFGRAAIVGVKVTTLLKACDNAVADNNHALVEANPNAKPGDAQWTSAEASAKLATDLKAAYGADLKDDEVFTVVSLVVLNPDHVGV